MVGGAVRDFALGIPPGNDFDLVTRHSAIQLAGHLYKSGLSLHPPVTYPRFGTAMLSVDSAAIELVTARKESYHPDSRKPSVTPATYLEDSTRRDFTVNTLMIGLHSGEILDPLGTGLDDLKSKTLRTPLDPAATFADDPLRMLRAIRFKGKLGFFYAPGLVEGIRSSKDRLTVISLERIRDEFLKMLILPAGPECLQELLEFGLLEIFAPEFLPMVDCEQGKFHHLDVWKHTLLVLRNVQPTQDLSLCLGALFHDIGKPPTRTRDEKGQTRFFGHESVGAAITKNVLLRLKLPNREIDEVVMLVKNHMRLGSTPEFTASAARRVIRDLGDQTDRLLALVEADAASLRPGVRALDLEPIKQRLKEVQMLQPKPSLESPLSGEEIMSLMGIAAGPQVGQIKHLLTEAVLDGTLASNDKEAAILFLKNVH